MLNKQKAYQEESDRWNELFNETTLQARQAAEGLIQKAAFVHSMCWELEQVLAESGAIKVNPKNPLQQKEIPAVKVYARLSESYANIVNKLNTLRTRNILEGEDEELSDYE